MRYNGGAREDQEIEKKREWDGVQSRIHPTFCPQATYLKALNVLWSMLQDMR